MNKEQEKIWKEACEEAKISTGYLPAELLLLPMLIKMVEEGKIEVGGSEDFMVIGSKGTLSKQERRDPDISRSSTTHYPDWDKKKKEYVVPPNKRKGQK